MFSKGGSEAIKCRPENPVAPVMKTRLLIIVSNSIAPIIKQVAERLLERNTRPPSGPADELRRIGEEDGDVRGPESLRINLHPYFSLAQREEDIQDLSDGVGGPPAAVGDFA